MKLADYMKAHSISRAEFAERIDVTPEAVRRYLSGRIPTPKVMAKIALATGCKVTANDFFGIAA
jgi:transcriptional regulator with XRE-family HTH domain